MKILVGCEESQIVTLKLRNLGHEAYSCDIKETSGFHPEYHIQKNIREVLNNGWDMLIAFPPCTYLAVSGRWHFHKRRQEQEDAIKFVKELYYSNITHVAIENPIGVLSTRWIEPTQIIQPWQFGDGYQKATCLWLKNLKTLKPTNRVPGRDKKFINNMKGKGEYRQTLKSKTPNGLAEAMAIQWTQPQVIQLEI